MKDNKKIYLVAAALSVVAFLVYLPSIGNGFVNWDDQAYVYDNPFIRSFDLGWLLTAEVMGNWHPLTMLTYVADYAVWGLDPRGYHLVNTVLHALNTGLAAVFAFLFFRAAAGGGRGADESAKKGALFAAITAAIIFGLHPQRVESVAWISERKDVVSGFFFLLSLIFYMRYAAPPRNGWAINYAASLVCFVLALLGKPMAITLPAVLLLLDAYPLGRLSGMGKIRKAVVEKIPFFAVAAAAAYLAVWAQRSGGALAPLAPFPLSSRVMAAGKAVVFYLYKMALPFGLAPFYPREAHPSFLSIEYAGAFAVVAAVSIICFWVLRKKRIFAVLWLYYLVTLSPVIGIIQVGSQAAADRYTYLPSLGPALLLAAGAGYLFTKRPAAAKAMPLVVVLAAAVLSLIAMRQARVWNNPFSLWSRQIAVYPEAPIGHVNMGMAYKDAGDLNAAVGWYERALGIDPFYGDAYMSRGVAYSAMGRHAAAMEDYTTVMRLRPVTPEVLNNRGAAYMGLKEFNRAVEDFSAAIAMAPANPLYARSYYNRGTAYRATGENDKALSDFNRAIELNPAFPGAHNNRGGVYLRTGRYEEAADDYRTAIRLEPGNPLAYYNLGLVYEMLGDRARAMESFRAAASLGLPQAREYLKRLGE